MPLNFAQWNVGDIILDLYKVTDILGEGGFGKVYKVRHQGWNIDLAVKIPKPEIVEAAGGVENFEREAETWVNLGLHPHTVSCYYVRQIDSNPVVFAEYVAGGSLHDWIYSRSLYAGETETSLKRIIDIGIQFAWGLHYAHEQGLIHQDVKPANVMMTAEGLVKVTDFGLANALTNNQEREPQANRVANSTLMVAGSGAMTPAYCSPEQANGNNLTRRTDLWSWALSVLEMFQGERTWGHGTVAAGALEYYLESNSEYSHLPQMPILLAQLLRRCFRENPSERPHNMLEVANELQSIYQQVIGGAYPQQQPQTGKDIADSLNNRAVSLFDLGKQEEALQLWEQALQVQPQHPESTYNRGLMLWRSGQIDDDTLVEALNDAQRSHSVDGNVKYLLSLVHLERNDCKAAIEILESIQGQEVSKDEVRSTLILARERDNSLGCLFHTLEGHTSAVNSVYLSADNQFALSGSTDKTLKLWKLATGDCLHTFEGHTSAVNSVYLSTDNQFALSGSTDKTLKLWKLATGDCLHTFEGHTSAVNSVCLSADNQYILSAGFDQTLKFWELSTGHCLHTFEGHTGTVSSVYLSLNKQFALSGSWDKTLKLWEVATGRCLRTFEGHTDYLSSVFLSADNKLALSGSFDQTLKLWEVATGRCLRTFEGHIDRVRSVSLSTNEQFALSGSSDKTLKLWEVTTGRCLRTFRGNSERVNSICVGEHNQFLLTANSKNIVIEAINLQGNIYLAPIRLSRVLDIQTIMSFNYAYTHGLEQAKIALSKREYIAAAQYINKVRSQSLYNRDEEAFKMWKTLYIYLTCKTFISAWEDLVFKNIYAIRSVCLSVNNQFILLGSEDGTLNFWEISTAKCLRTFKGHTGSVNLLCLSIDNQFAISGSEDGTLKFWEVATGRCLHIFLKAGNVNSVCLSDDNQFAITGSNDQTLRVWELNTGTCLRTIKGNIIGSVNSVCLSANNLFCVFASHNALKLWEIATGRLIRTFKGHISTVNSVCLSIDNRFALSGSNDETLKLWEVTTGRCLNTFKGHTGIVSSVCLSADNKFALSGGGDKTLKLWEVATGRCLRTFEGYTGTLSSVYLSNNKQFALSASSDGALKLWILDWELEDKSLAEWDEGARIHLENFLTIHTPYAPALRGNYNPTSVFTRRGIPAWSEEDFQNLLYTLGCAGYGLLHPQVVRHHLEKMTTYWKLIDTEKKIYYILLNLDLKIFPKNINIFIAKLFYNFLQSKIFKIFKAFIYIFVRFIQLGIIVLLWFLYLGSLFRGNS